MPETSESSEVRRADTVGQPAEQDRSTSKPDTTEPDDNKPDSPQSNDSHFKASKRDLPNLVITKSESTMPDYRDADREQLKDLFKERGLTLEGKKKQTLEWYRCKLVRDDAKVTTYREYKFTELKNELRWRGKDVARITKKLQAIKCLEDDDREKGNKGLSMEPKKAHQPKEKPKPDKPPAPSATDRKGFTVSMTLQIIGKSSEARIKPLTQTWSLPASYDPNLTLNVLGWLTITTPDGRRPQFSARASSEKHMFQVNSLVVENKKRKKSPLSDAGDDGLRLPKKPNWKPRSISETCDDGQEPTNPLATRIKSPEDGRKKNTIPPKDLSLGMTAEKAPAASSATPMTAMNEPFMDTALAPLSSSSDPGSSLFPSPPPSPLESEARKSFSPELSGSKSPSGSLKSCLNVNPSEQPRKPTSPKELPSSRSKSDHDAHVRKSGLGSSVMGTSKGMRRLLRLADRGSTQRPRFSLVGAVRRSTYRMGKKVCWWWDVLRRPRRRPAVATSWGEWAMEYLHM
jgi:hypothetical protein